MWQMADLGLGKSTFPPSQASFAAIFPQTSQQSRFAKDGRKVKENLGSVWCCGEAENTHTLLNSIEAWAKQLHGNKLIKTMTNPTQMKAMEILLM